MAADRGRAAERRHERPPAERRRLRRQRPRRAALHGSARNKFFYYNEGNLTALRVDPWKMHFASEPGGRYYDDLVFHAMPRPYNLRKDPTGRHGGAIGFRQMMRKSWGMQPAIAIRNEHIQMCQQAIAAAEERLRVATPYFVPDGGAVHALHLAPLRGVDVRGVDVRGMDVRALTPEVGGSELVDLSPYAFVGSLLKSGVRVPRHGPGRTHQKAVLVDRKVAGVGTANLDDRPFRDRQRRVTSRTACSISCRRVSTSCQICRRC